MRRTTPIIMSVLLAFALTACGDDSVEPVAEPNGTTAPPTIPPTNGPDSVGYQHPTGADEVVVSIAQEGGFAPAEMIFASMPSFLVSGDGRQFTPGPQIAIYPGPLLPNIQVADLGEEGVQEFLALADEHGLLQERDYESPTNIADATDTVVTIRVGGETYAHRAYALGFEAGLDQSGAEVDDPARQQLAAFVAAVTSSASPETTSFEPERFLVRATPVDDLTGYEVEPTILPWPIEIDLGSADDCIEIPAEAIGATFADANQLTFFEQEGLTYQLAVKPALPGMTC